MWILRLNEKTQEQLDDYPRAMKFATKNDQAQTKKTISLASVIWRLVIKQEPTYYKYEDGHETPQCGQAKRRSVEDIYSVAKFYMKKPASREQIERAMDILVAANYVSKIFCSVVKRRVHYPKNLQITLTQIKQALKDE